MFYDECLGAASQLDELAKEYDGNCGTYSKLLDKLENQRVSAQSTVRDAECLLNTIKKTPHEFSVEIKDLETEVKKFTVNSNNYETVKTNLKRGAAGMGIAAVGGVILLICTSLKDAVGGIIKSKKLSTIQKILAILVAALIVFVPILIVWGVTSHKTKKLQDTIRVLSKENGRLISCQEACRQHTEKLSMRTSALRQRLTSLQSLSGCSFENLREREQYALMSLVRETRALAISINEVPEWL